MARVKGKYVATVVIDFDYDDTSNLRPFDEMREIVIEGRFLEHITDVMKEEYELENATTVSVETQFADLYRVEKKNRMSDIKFVKVDVDESEIVKNVPLTKGEAAAIANFIDANLIQTIKDADFVTMLFLKNIIHGYEKLCECGGYTGITEGKFE